MEEAFYNAQAATQPHFKVRTTDYFYPRTKVKDLGFQQHSSVPHFASILQEAPMQPSRVPNHLLPDPSPRGMLPLKGPERCHLERLASPLCSPHFRGPIHSLSPTNTGSPVNRSHLMPRDRLGPLQPVVMPPTRSLCSPRLAPVSSTDGVASPQFMKDLSNHTLSPHIGRDQTTGPRITVCYPGGRNATVQRLESNKAQSQDVRSRSPMQTVQLKRPPIGALINTRALVPLSDPDWGRSQSTQWECKPFHNTHLADRSRGSRLPIMQCAVAPCQDRQLKLTPSSEKFIPAVDLNCSSEKRRRESEDGDDGAKKLCSQSLNSGKAQTPEPTNSFCTSLASQPPPRPSSVSELLPKTTDSPSTEPACGLSTPTHSSCAPLFTKHCITRQPMGAKQAYINAVQTHPMKVLELSSPSKLSLKKRREDNDKRKLCASLSYEGPLRDTGSSPYLNSNCHNTDHTRRRASIPTVKTLSRDNSAESDNGTLKPASNSHSGSQNGRTLERNKTAHSRRHSFQNDYEELFTPDPLTYVVSNGQKTAKPKMEGGTITPEKMFSPSTQTSSSSNSLTGSSCQKTQSATVTSSSHSVDTNIFPQDSSSSQARQPHVSMPTVTLQRVKLEDLRSITPEESVHKRPSVGPKDLKPALSGTDTAASEKSSTTSQCSLPPLKERRASREGSKQANEEDPIDVELDLDLGLSFAVNLDLTQDSHSSEEEQLISLQEMMERVTKPPPDTPEKGAFSEPSTPGHHSSQPRTQNFPPATKSVNYKNTLDQMLEEINTNKKAKEIETQLLTACEEDLLRIAEYEEAEETREEGISSEHQEFLQRYSLMSNAIKEVAPGEVVFNLEKFGRIFDQDTLQLRKCMVNPQGTVQKTLLWSSPAQLKLWVNIELFQEAYDSRSPCPTQVTRFLFKMMSVHSERLVSENILQALCDIACTAAYQIVKNDSKQFQVWMPSLADVALVLMNMGVAFVTLFPFENFQPRFTEGDLLEDVYIKSESPSSNKKEPRAFPGHNCNNIFKYLSYCMGLCPRAYSDNELLLLMTVVGRVGLESRLILQSSVELYPFMYQIVYNFRDWDTMLPRICQALTDLTDDHHNMCLVVQLLPDNTRGKQLRRHLSLAMISKLLDGTCTYTPREEEMQLSELRPFLPRMQPSALLRGLRSRTTRQDQEEDMVTLDQQSYYLCYSLLTLANETSNFQFFPAHQKEQLMFLCSELETHIKCDIRESEKCLYRSKVKDLVARIYTKWQMLLQRTRPLHGKLYDYWQPLFSDTLTSSQEDHVVNNNNNNDDDDNGEMSDMDEEEEELDEDKERSDTEHNDVEMTAEDEETQDGDDTEQDRNKMADNNTKPEETERDIKGEDDDTNKPEAIEAGDAEEDQNNILDDTNKPKDVDGDNTGDDTNNLEGMQSDDDTVNYVIESEEATESESVHGELSGEMPDTETPVLNKDSEVKEADAETTERTEVVDTENLVNGNASQEPGSVV